jgi:hypothetical protein
LKYPTSSLSKGIYRQKDSCRENENTSNFQLNSNNDVLKNKYIKKLKENKENIPFNKQDKLSLEIHKSLKLISKKGSYNNSKKSNNNSNKSIDEIKSDKKMNKTLNKIKSNNNPINKGKNPNHTIDNFKKTEKIKKFSHKNKSSSDFTEMIERKKEKKNNIIKKIQNVEIKSNEISKINIFEEEDEAPIKYFDVSKINNVQIPKEYLNIIYYNLLKEQENNLKPKADTE